MENIFIDFLPPWVETGLQPAFYDKESGTVLQQTARMYAKMNEIIKSVNGQNSAIEEYIQKFIELKDYVDQYFDDLNVQEEINNKLDAMVLDGTMAEIINQEIFGELNTKIETLDSEGIIKLDTLSDLVAYDADAGKVILLLGKEAINDGNGGLYRITSDSGDISLTNGKYATRLNNVDEDYYDEVTVEMKRNDATNYYITKIPHLDNEDNQINITVNPSGARDNLTPFEYANASHTTLTANASLSVQNNDTWVEGSIISNGQIYRDYNPVFLSNEYVYLGIKADGSMHSYQANVTTAQDMIDDGVIQACLVFEQLIANSVVNANPQHHLKKDNNMWIGQDADKDVYILTCDGRNSNNVGFSNTEAITIFQELGCINVWSIDGGGSTALEYKGAKVNMPSDDNGRKERKIAATFNVSKPIVNLPTAKAYSQIGKMNHIQSSQLLPLTNTKEREHIKVCYRISPNQVLDTSASTLTLTPLFGDNRVILNNDGTFSLDLNDDTESDYKAFRVDVQGQAVVQNTSNSGASAYIGVGVGLSPIGAEDIIARTTTNNNDYYTLPICGGSSALGLDRKIAIWGKTASASSNTIISGTIYIDIWMENRNKVTETYM